jgi:hypothetical protein
MKTNELRIGNYALGASRGDTIKVTAELMLSLEKGLLSLGAIPTTEKWLVKFGFEGTKFLIGKGNFIYSIENCTLTWFGIALMPTLWDEVHNFQNLYFALTGEELQLK